MSARDILARARASKIEVWLEQDRPQVAASAPPELVEELRAHKDELAWILAEEGQQAAVGLPRRSNNVDEPHFLGEGAVPAPGRRNCRSRWEFGYRQARAVGKSHEQAMNAAFSSCLVWWRHDHPGATWRDALDALASLGIIEGQPPPLGMFRAEAAHEHR